MVASCDAFGCTYSCKKSSGLSFSQDPCCKCSKQIILMEMDAERTFIVQVPHRKMKTLFFVCSNHLKKKNPSSETLKWGILYLFPCPGNPQTILKPFHRQPFLLASIPAQTIFLTCFIPWINKQSLFCNFYISALASSLL